MKKKRALMVLPVLAVWFAFLISCVTIDAVTQPEKGSLGQEIETVVNNTTGSDDNATAIPVFAVNLPLGWEIVSCMALFNGTTLYSCDQPDPAHSAIVNKEVPGNWHSRRMPIQGLDAGDTMQVTWTILPTSAGKHELDYWTSVYYYDSWVGVWSYENEIDPQTDPIPFNHKISISTAIPALSGTSAFIFSGLLMMIGLGYLMFRKKGSGNPALKTLLLALLVPAMVYLLLAGGSACADDKPAFSRGGLMSFKNLLNEDHGLREALAQNPRETVQQHFALTREQQAFLDQLTHENLRTVAEMFISAEEVDDMKCMFLNIKQPRLTCIIFEEAE